MCRELFEFARQSYEAYGEPCVVFRRGILSRGAREGMPRSKRIVKSIC
jgi:hypothetical protein